MTMLDPHLDVDQLSAAVDGLADEATSAHLATCLACKEQVEVWRRSLGQLKDLATVDVPAPDDAIAAALAAWDPAPAAPPAPALVAPVTPISTARAARRRWRPSGQLIAAVAAVVIVFGGVFSLVKLGGGGASSSKSSGAASVATGSSGSGSSGSSGSSSSSGSRASASGGASASPHSSPSAGKLAPAITTSRRAVLSAELRTYTATNPKGRVATSTPCLREAKAAADKAAVAAAGGPAVPSFLVPVTYRGVSSRAFIFSRSTGYVAFVLRDGTCTLVTSLDF